MTIGPADSAMKLKGSLSTSPNASEVLHSEVFEKIVHQMLRRAMS